MTLFYPVCRNQDAHGSGHYGDPRGTRLHHGEDMPCRQGAQIVSVCKGVVTKIGWPYDPEDPNRGHLRYIEITTDDGDRVRYMYVRPFGGIEPGVKVEAGDRIGMAQGLLDVYPGITDHIHFEVFDSKHVYYNPLIWLANLWIGQQSTPVVEPEA